MNDDSFERTNLISLHHENGDPAGMIQAGDVMRIHCGWPGIPSSIIFLRPDASGRLEKLCCGQPMGGKPYMLSYYFPGIGRVHECVAELLAGLAGLSFSRDEKEEEAAKEWSSRRVICYRFKSL